MTDDNVKEVRMCFAEPAALGLLGLAIVTLVASSQKLGWTEGIDGMLPWVFFFGAFAQIIASLTEFKRNNAFGATAFAAYGLFWFAIGMTWYLGYQNDAAYLKQLGFAIIGMLIFNTYMLYGAGAMNKGMFFVFFFIELLFIGMILNIFMDFTPIFAGIAELGVAISAFYTSAAVVLEATAGFPVLPYGKPLWKLNKVEIKL